MSTEIQNNPQLRYTPNTGITKQWHNAQSNYVLAQQLLMDAYGSGSNSSWFQYFLIVKKYFSGLYLIEGQNDEIVNNHHFIIAKLWEYGELAIAKIGGHVQLFTILTKTYEGLNPKFLKVKSINLNGGVYEPLDLINGVNCVYLSWDNNNVPAIFFWGEILKEIVRLEKSFLVTSVWDTKKFIKLVNNNSQEIEQVETNSIMDPTQPIIKLVNPTSGMITNDNSTLLNILQPFNTGNSKSDQAFKNLWNYQKYAFNLLGVNINPPEKKERKLADEITQESYWLWNSENITLYNLKNAFKLWEKIYNEKLTVSLKNEEDPNEETKPNLSQLSNF